MKIKYPQLPLLVLISLSAGILQGCGQVIVAGAATGAAAVHDRRTVGTVIDDEGIELKALDAQLSDKELYDGTHINVTSYNGVVLLSGEAPTEDMRNRMVSIVKDLPKVRRVHNEIAVAAPSSLISRSSDALITSKVKIAIFRIEGFDPTRVKVVTENGTVFLMGLVTRNEGDKAADATRQVGGVQRVIKVFEYID